MTISKEQFNNVVSELINDLEDAMLDYSDNDNSFIFSSSAMIHKVFSSEVTFYSNGTIEISELKKINEKSFLNTDTDSNSAETLLERVVVKTGEALNYYEVLEFIEDYLA